MQIEDIASQDLRNLGKTQSETDNFIESFISRAQEFSSLKDANRYLGALREKVRTMFY